MPTDNESGLVEADIIINGRALTFAECMAVRVAVSSMRISLTDPAFRTGVGEPLASHYDARLAMVEHAMIPGMRMPRTDALDRVAEPVPGSVDELRTALDELIKLQAHYAELLNMHDGGQRHAFESADEWIERLREINHL